MKFPIKSIFEQINEKIFTMTDLEQAKKFVTEFVEGKNINPKDKQTILKAVNEAKSLQRFQFYICNSLLKYEGMGVGQMEKTAKETAAETAL